mgnify:FL=1
MNFIFYTIIKMSVSGGYSKNIIKQIEPKPIDLLIDRCDLLIEEFKCVKTDIKYIKEYIRKMEVRQQLKEDKEKDMEKEYVKTGWWYS